jgi:general secretion pathway protein G
MPCTRVTKSLPLFAVTVVGLLMVNAMVRPEAAAAPEDVKTAPPAAASLTHVQVSAAPGGGFIAFDSATGDVVKVAVDQQKSGVEWVGKLAKTADGKWEFKTGQAVGGVDTARLTAARADVTVIMTALNAYRLDNGKFPSTEEGLQALVVQPPGTDNWKGPYLKEVPKDPWGNPYVFRSPGKQNPKSVDVLSFGPDSRDGGGDDLYGQ